MSEPGQAAIAVVVPTYRRPGLLEQCLNSLAGQDLSGDRFEVVVIDDASGIETHDVLARASRDMPNLSWQSVPENRGPAHARNVAVRLATADLVLFVDDDIAAAPKLLQSHLEAHSSGDPLLGVVGLVEWHPGLRINRFMRWLDQGELQFAYRSWMREGPIDPPWKAFYTCNLSMRRELFLEVGGFDERFPYAAFEDSELAVRLSKSGFRLEYRPAALAWNTRPLTLEQFCSRMEKVGESRVVLQHLQPEEFPPESSDAQRGHGVRRLAEVMAGSVGRILPIGVAGRVRYRAEIDGAYRRGVESGARLWDSRADEG